MDKLVKDYIEYDLAKKVEDDRLVEIAKEQDYNFSDLDYSDKEKSAGYLEFDYLFEGYTEAQVYLKILLDIEDLDSVNLNSKAKFTFYFYAETEDGETVDLTSKLRREKDLELASITGDDFVVQIEDDRKLRRINRNRDLPSNKPWIDSYSVVKSDYIGYGIKGYELIDRVLDYQPTLEILNKEERTIEFNQILVKTKVEADKETEEDLDLYARVVVLLPKGENIVFDTKVDVYFHFWLGGSDTNITAKSSDTPDESIIIEDTLIYKVFNKDFVRELMLLYQPVVENRENEEVATSGCCTGRFNSTFKERIEEATNPYTKRRAILTQRQVTTKLLKFPLEDFVRDEIAVLQELNSLAWPRERAQILKGISIANDLLAHIEEYKDHYLGENE